MCTSANKGYNVLLFKYGAIRSVCKNSDKGHHCSSLFKLAQHSQMLFGLLNNCRGQLQKSPVLTELLWQNWWIRDLTNTKKDLLRRGPNYTGGISKRSYKFLRLGLASTLPAFGASNALFQPEKFENAGFPFSCTENTFWKRSFLKTTASQLSCDVPGRVFFKHNFKIIAVCVFKCLRRSVDAKHLMRFQIETSSVFKFDSSGLVWTGPKWWGEFSFHEFLVTLIRHVSIALSVSRCQQLNLHNQSLTSFH